MDQDVEFSVIIPTRNRINLIERCLRSIQENDVKGVEILIINDGSDKRTTEYLKTLDKGNIRIFNTEHIGQSSARNIGLRNAKGRFFLFTDDDCIVPKDWIKDITAAFRNIRQMQWVAR